MPTIYNLNQPPHPFWDFVANFEDHPFFGGYTRANAYAPRDNAGQEQQQEQPAQATEKAPEQNVHQPTVEDDPNDQEAPRLRGIGENPNHKDKPSEPETSSGGERDIPFRGRCGGRGFRGGPPGDGPRHHHRGGGPERGRGGHHGRGGFPGRGPWWMHGGPPPHHHGGGPPHHEHHRGPPHGGRHGPGGFQLPDFLQDLGERLGLDISGAVDGPSSTDKTSSDNSVDFEPRSDVFDTPTSYVIHTSLPGAQKSDLGVEWDAENSTLRITGVVHRPGVDEQLLKHLAVDGRKREVGVFEKAVVLGTRRAPAGIVVEGIKAKMVDGVLVVTVPKREFERTEISIGGDSPGTETAGDDVEMEKEEKEVEMEEVEEDHNNEKKVETVVEEETQSAEEKHHDHEQPEHSDEEGEYVRIDVD